MARLRATTKVTKSGKVRGRRPRLATGHQFGTPDVPRAARAAQLPQQPRLKAAILAAIYTETRAQKRTLANWSPGGVRDRRLSELAATAAGLRSLVHGSAFADDSEVRQFVRQLRGHIAALSSKSNKSFMRNCGAAVSSLVAGTGSRRAPGRPSLEVRSTLQLIQDTHTRRVALEAGPGIGDVVRDLAKTHNITPDTAKRRIRRAVCGDRTSALDVSINSPIGVGT